MKQIDMESPVLAGVVRASERAIEQVVVGKIIARLIPFMFVLYIVAFLDRINVGFAALEMNQALGLSAEAFGMGAGLFFIGYMFCEVPSNLILARVGARRWIARIMITWGLIAMATAFIRGAHSFYALRLLLGMAEAGFFPGLILYLTYWFRARDQARAVALFMTATVLAGAIGGPISGALLGLKGMLGLAGWQWLFLLEGFPAIALGFTVLVYLPDGPADARWLTGEEREWLRGALSAESRERDRVGLHGMRELFREPVVWMLCALYFCHASSNYGIGMWLPQIIKGFGRLSSVQIGALYAIPSVAAAIGMVLIGRSSDRRGERRWHIALSAFTAALAFLLSAWLSNPALSLAAISLGAIGISGVLGPFWTLPPSFLGGTAAAAGIAFINSIGNVGGFAGPYAVGVLLQHTHSFSSGLLAIAGAMTFVGLVALAIRPATMHHAD
jgi:ACS family tartrate transporter-like MFS transporter